MGNFQESTLAEFDPPAYPYVDDNLTPAQKLDWSKQISEWMNTEITAKQPDGSSLPGPGDTDRTPLPQFFNGTVTAFDVNQDPLEITWTGFPNIVAVEYPNDLKRWKVADSARRYQDEYLEWSVKRDQDDKIIVATFTCEGPEYWHFLATAQPETLDSLYYNLNPLFKDKMKKGDWWTDDGKYDAENKWNNSTTNGSIVHLVHINNTLGAEVDIAAQGTVIRKDKDGKIITDKAKLINCSAYGSPQRNSDPRIGDAINSQARQGNSLSIANPVAIYMHSFDTGNFKLDVEGTGENMVDVPKGTFNVQRGSLDKHLGLRLQIQIPNGVVGTGPDNKGQQLTVSDIVDTSNNQNILYAAQFADYIQMTVKGVAIGGGEPADPLPCPVQSRSLLASLDAAAEGIVPEGAVAACNASKNKPRLGTRW
ncbi:hypothetical protein QBC42DRAFT_268512 [Cladorrhinum samala]|uniref:Uncharacterized protein n=1 Tax=Cladorrhinum samala TaxID=585594 RepID=A0AAV9HRK5_9PEZI|nr:hypothetical protein QBC42DRAFT_268512 [Cladorrhinum samala]